MDEKVRIVFLGGVGEVTKNMFVYEYWRDGKIADSIIVDCGIGFSETGDEIVMPDVTYLLNKQETLRAVVLTHGHEDHTSGLSTLLSQIRVPVYGTRLTVALAEGKLADHGIQGELHPVKHTQILNFGAFQVSFTHVTHSIPDATNLIIKTPLGVLIHASDFKFDWSPVDGWPTEVGKIAMAGESGVLCLLSDCVRAERDGYTLSEETIEDHLELQVRKAHGKVIFTTMSSNISRIQQAVNVASAFNRKIMFLGRSMRQNVEAAQHLGYLHFPKKSVVHAKSIKKIPSNKLFIIAAGSQAQEDSALSRIADNAHKDISLAPHDMVIFSADPIPGYERQVHKLVNKMTKLGADVVYSDINDELHVSGHGASHDLMLMMGLTRPKYIVPIGGESRQVRQYFLLAEKMGHTDDTLFAPEEKDAIEFTRDGKARIIKKVA
ncbi:MAG: ribonuclease J [Candidatus Roizmanbacteria bacterium]|nr:ribonuclease J [Candidatus Roizmanbacteria bacterium]